MGKQKSTACTLGVDTLGDLNGGSARAIINKALADAISDVEDRAADDGKTRSVNIRVDIWRMKEGQVAIDASCSFKPPTYTTEPTVAKIRQVGPGRVGAVFQPMSADNPDQEELPFDGSEQPDRGSV